MRSECGMRNAEFVRIRFFVNLFVNYRESQNPFSALRSLNGVAGALAPVSRLAAVFL